MDSALTSGTIGLLFVDDGRLTELGGDEVSPLVASDLWQAIKELCPNKARRDGFNTIHCCACSTRV